MASSTLHGDVYVDGNLSARSLIPSDSSVTNQKVGTSDPIDATKTINRHCLHVAQVTGTAVIAATTPIYCARTDGTILEIDAAVSGAVATGADRTVTIDVLNGTSSVLSSTIVMNNTSTLRHVYTTSIASGTVAAGAVLSVSVAVAGSAGAQAQGLIVNVWVDEDPS